MNQRSSKRTTVQSLRSQLKASVASAILEAAEAVIGQQGADAKMEAIAAKAGVAVGTLYNHFADRQALLTALVEQHRRDMLAKLERAVAGSSGKPLRERLEAVLTTMFSTGMAHARFKLLLMEGTGAYFARRKQLRERFAATLTPLFDEARAKGELVSDDDGLQVAMLFGLVISVFALRRESGADLTAETAARAVTRAFLDGAAPRSLG